MYTFWVKAWSKRDMGWYWDILENFTELQCRKMVKRCCLENRNHEIVRETGIHCELGKWWSRTTEIRSSCTLGVGPWTYHAQVLCLSVCLLVFLPPVGSLWDSGVPEERNPDLPQLACLSTAYCQHPHAQQHCHLERSPSHSLCFFLCVHIDTVSFFTAQTHKYVYKCTHNALNTQSEPQRTAGFHWCTPKQLEGRFICFCLEMKAPHVIV